MEVASLTSQLEVSSSVVQDKTNQLGYVTERRNSLDSTLSEVTACLVAREEEVSSLTVQLERCGSVSARQVDQLMATVEALTLDMQRAGEEVDLLGVARDNLLAQVEEQREDNRQLVTRLQEAEIRLTAVQVHFIISQVSQLLEH